MASIPCREVDDRRELEDMYSRFGWKWAVLAHMAATTTAHGTALPPRIVEDLRLARTRMESGCHSLCDIAADLRHIEIQLFPVLLGVSEGEVHAMMGLLSKAMNGSLERRDIDLSPLRPVLVDCSIPRLCTNSTSDRRALML